MNTCSLFQWRDIARSNIPLASTSLSICMVFVQYPVPGLTGDGGTNSEVNLSIHHAGSRFRLHACFFQSYISVLQLH